jgi:hypothetical protein
VKIHKITPATGKERGDIELKDYVVKIARTPGLDRLPSSSTYAHIGFYLNTHTFRKITVKFSWPADALEAFGWNP